MSILSFLLLFGTPLAGESPFLDNQFLTSNGEEFMTVDGKNFIVQEA